MKYESAKTEKGNVGVSYDSQEAADLQAAAMDKNGCSGCSGCSRCTDCSDCSDCSGCHGCTDTQGTLRWKGGPAKALLSLNGLRWPVSTDGKSIQIGCQYHSVGEWQAFDDRVIAKMDPDALEFWKAHKEMVLGLAEVRKNMEEES